MKKRKEAFRGQPIFIMKIFCAEPVYIGISRTAGGILRDHCFEYQYRKCGYLYPKDFKDYFSSGRK